MLSTKIYIDILTITNKGIYLEFLTNLKLYYDLVCIFILRFPDPKTRGIGWKIPQSLKDHFMQGNWRLPFCHLKIQFWPFFKKLNNIISLELFCELFSLLFLWIRFNALKETKLQLETKISVFLLQKSGPTPWPNEHHLHKCQQRTQLLCPPKIGLQGSWASVLKVVALYKKNTMSHHPKAVEEFVLHQSIFRKKGVVNNLDEKK